MTRLAFPVNSETRRHDLNDYGHLWRMLPDLSHFPADALNTQFVESGI